MCSPITGATLRGPDFAKTLDIVYNRNIIWDHNCVALNEIFGGRHSIKMGAWIMLNQQIVVDKELIGIEESRVLRTRANTDGRRFGQGEMRLLLGHPVAALPTFVRYQAHIDASNFAL